ncbi:MAG: hypothetical protein R2856_26785 [Caldilineaceae bacterium]
MDNFYDSSADWVSSRSAVTEAGQLVVLVTSLGKRFLIQLPAGAALPHTSGHDSAR